MTRKSLSEPKPERGKGPVVGRPEEAVLTEGTLACKSSGRNELAVTKDRKQLVAAGAK